MLRRYDAVEKILYGCVILWIDNGILNDHHAVEILKRRGAVASRVELMTEVWGYSAAVLSRTVDTHIAELRRKLEPAAPEPTHILTVRKVGYRLDQGARV